MISLRYVFWGMRFMCFLRLLQSVLELWP